jgi:hypothetical protein
VVGVAIFYIPNLSAKLVYNKFTNVNNLKHL